MSEQLEYTASQNVGDQGRKNLLGLFDPLRCRGGRHPEFSAGRKFGDAATFLFLVVSSEMNETTDLPLAIAGVIKCRWADGLSEAETIHRCQVNSS